MKVLPFRQAGPAKRLVQILIHSVRLRALSIKLGGRFSFGQNVRFGKGADVRPPSFMSLGSNISAGKNLTVECNLQVGDDVLISSNVSFISDDHHFDDPSNTVYWQGRKPEATVVVEGDNLLGYGVIVIGNVRIGKGCIVGAGSVVTRDLPPYTVCVGTPARPIRHRFPFIQ